MKLYQERSHETHGPGALFSDNRERERERERETESKVDAADTWKEEDEEEARMWLLA